MTRDTYGIYFLISRLILTCCNIVINVKSAGYSVENCFCKQIIVPTLITDTHPVKQDCNSAIRSFLTTSLIGPILGNCPGTG